MHQRKNRLLASVKTGETVKLVSVNAGQGLNSRLASMGLLPNVEMKVLRNGHPGPFVVSVKDSKMMLGGGVAGKITVR